MSNATKKTTPGRKPKQEKKAKYTILSLTEREKALISEAVRHEELRLGGTISINTFITRAAIAAANQELMKD
jgi:hypothetical protein